MTDSRQEWKLPTFENLSRRPCASGELGWWSYDPIRLFRCTKTWRLASTLWSSPFFTELHSTTVVYNVIWWKFACWSETSRSFAARSQKKVVRSSLLYCFIGKLIRISIISCTTDPLVHHGRHFGRTVHPLCNVTALVNNGLLYIGEFPAQPEETFTHECVLFPLAWMFIYLFTRQRRENRIFTLLLQMVPGLEERLVGGSEENVLHVAELVRFSISKIYGQFDNTIHADPERRVQRQVGWHQKPKRCNSGLDYSTGAISQPAPGSKCQNRPGISSWGHRCLAVPCWCWLVWHRVGSLYYFSRTLLQSVESRKSSVVVRWPYLGTNGRYFSIVIAIMTRTIPGTVCSRAIFLFLCVFELRFNAQAC